MVDTEQQTRGTLRGILAHGRAPREAILGEARISGGCEKAAWHDDEAVAHCAPRFLGRGARRENTMNLLSQSATRIEHQPQRACSALFAAIAAPEEPKPDSRLLMHFDARLSTAIVAQITTDGGQPRPQIETLRPRQLHAGEAATRPEDYHRLPPEPLMGSR